MTYPVIFCDESRELFKYEGHPGGGGRPQLFRTQGETATPQCPMVSTTSYS